MADIVTPFQGTDLFNTANFNSRIAEANAELSVVPTLVRPNLLDNWYFGNPVNQRGQAEYTGGYGIDRWYILNTNKMSVQSDCVIFTYVDNNYNVLERLENLVSGTYTLSLLFKDGTLITNTKAIDVSQASYVFNTPRYNGWNVQLHDDKTVRITCIGNSGDTAAILAVKLELGPTQTLAHREGDKWVLNEVPDYGEELRRCQRYYRVLGGTQNQAFSLAIRREATKLEAFVPFDAAMRVPPSFIATGDIKTLPDYLGLMFIGVDTASSQGCSVFFSRTDGGTFEKDSYLIYGDIAARIIASADL